MLSVSFRKKVKLVPDFLKMKAFSLFLLQALKLLAALDCRMCNPTRHTHVGRAGQIIAYTSVQLNACLVKRIPKYMNAGCHHVKPGLWLRNGVMGVLRTQGREDRVCW